MPRFTARGDWCAGVGGDGVHAVVNDQIVDPGPGGAGDWLNDDEFVSARWTSYQDFRAVAISKAGVQRELRPGVFEHVYAGGGRWATVGQGKFILDDGTETLPIVGFGRDGSLVTWAHGAGGFIIAGRKVSDAVVYESHVIDANTAIWLEPNGSHTIGMPIPKLLPGVQYGLRVAFDGHRWWALYTSTYIGRLVLHPFDSFEGYALTQPFNPRDSSTWAYRPDLVIRDGKKRVIWATIESEQLGQIAGPYVADEQFPLQPLLVAPPPPPPPPPEDPVPTPNMISVIRAVDAEAPELLRENSKASCGQFTERCARRLYAIDPGWGLLSKSPGENNWKGHAVDAVCHKPELQVVDIIGSSGSGRPTSPTWNHQSRRPKNLWMQPIGAEDEEEQPPPGETHRYDGGGHDTGICDLCGKPRMDPVHATPESKVAHTYDGGEQDTGQCDLCGAGLDAAIHQRVIDPPPPGDEGARLTALEQKVEELRGRIDRLERGDLFHA